MSSLVISNSLYLRGTNICPLQLNNRSTIALLGNAELHFMKASANRGYFRTDVTSCDIRSRR